MGKIYFRCKKATKYRRENEIFSKDTKEVNDFQSELYNKGRLYVFYYHFENIEPTELLEVLFG